ncbi:MAG: enterochelin esterase [Gemmatales bacterium]
MSTTTLRLVAIFAISIVTCLSALEPQSAPILSPQLAKLQLKIEVGGRDALPNFWTDLKQTPLIESIPGDARHRWVTFLWRGQGNIKSIVISSALNSGQPTEGQMQRLGNTDLWYKTYRLRDDVRAGYMFVVTESVEEEGKSLGEKTIRLKKTTVADPLNINPKGPPDSFGYRESLLELSNTPSQPWIVRHPEVPAGKLIETKFKSQRLNNERALTIYTPPGYSKEKSPYGLLIVFDRERYTSKNYVETPVILDNLLHAGKIPPLVAVFVGNVNRNQELPCHAPFADFLTEELVPWVRSEYSTTRDPSKVIVAGSSYGGLAATYAAWKHPEVFGKVLSQSGSFWWHLKEEAEGEWLTRQIASSPTKPVHFYLDVGLLEGWIERQHAPTQVSANRHLRDVLTAKGYSVEYAEFNGGHDYLNWKGTFSDGMIALVGQPTNKTKTVTLGSRNTVVTADNQSQIPIKKIDDIFARWNKTNSPGVVVAVIRDGKMVYQRGYGMANLELDTPLNPNSVFYIASTSKQFTAACIALLARQGKISLDDDVRKYIKELPNYGRPITIRHLIHHTSGLRDYLSVNAISGRTTAGITTDDAVRMIVKQKELNALPGEEYLYTNSGYVLMSAIIERVTGKPLRQYAQENIFQPLGMTHSVFRDDRGMIIKRRVVGYSSASDGSFRTSDPDNETTGSGNLWTTVGDLLLWDQNFYQNKLGDGLIEQLLTPGTLQDGHRLNYAYGLHVEKHRGLPVVRHSGAFAGFRSEMVRFPEQRLTVICLANLSSISPGDLAPQVADLFLAGSYVKEPTKPSAVNLSQETLASYAGTYRDPRDGDLWKFVLSGNSLKMERSGLLGVPLVATGEKTFRDEDGQRGLTFEFVPSTAGRSRQVRIQIDDLKPRLFDLIEPVVYKPNELESYTGSYYSSEADAAFRIVLDQGRLYVEAPRRPRQPLRAGARNEFIASSGTVQFEMDQDHHVTGFRYNLPRARKVQFIRQSQQK